MPAARHLLSVLADSQALEGGLSHSYEAAVKKGVTSFSLVLSAKPGLKACSQLRALS